MTSTNLILLFFVRILQILFFIFVSIYCLLKYVLITKNLKYEIS